MSPERRWQVSLHRITRVPDTVLVVHLGANLGYIFECILQNRRKRFGKVLMKNIKMVRVSPKCHSIHRVLKNRAACQGTTNEYFALWSMQISMGMHCIITCCSGFLTLNHHYLMGKCKVPSPQSSMPVYNTLPCCYVYYTVHNIIDFVSFYF